MSGYLGLTMDSVTTLLSQSAPLIIGSLILQDHEVPSHITIGGSQAVTMHKLPGGGRIIDAMGPDDGAVAWRGLFIGPNAAQRARSLDVMRVQGTPQVLSFGDYSFSVIIVHCEYDYQQRGAIINYRIRTEIVPNSPDPTTISPDVDVAVQNDLDAGRTVVMASAAAAATYVSLVGKSDAAKTTASAYGMTVISAGMNMTAVAAATTKSSTIAADKSLQMGLEDVAMAVQANIHSLPTPSFTSTSLASIATASGLAVATVQAGTLAALVRTSGYVNRARANVASAGARIMTSLVGG